MQVCVAPQMCAIPAISLLHLRRVDLDLYCVFIVWSYYYGLTALMHWMSHRHVIERFTVMHIPNC